MQSRYQEYINGSIETPHGRPSQPQFGPLLALRRTRGGSSCPTEFGLVHWVPPAAETYAPIALGPKLPLSSVTCLSEVRLKWSTSPFLARHFSAAVIWWCVWNWCQISRQVRKGLL